MTRRSQGAKKENERETIICALLGEPLPAGANRFVACKAIGVDRPKYEAMYASELMKRRNATRKHNGKIKPLP